MFSSVILDNWILLTYQGGDRYNGSCDNNSRTASLMLACGSNKVRRTNEKCIEMNRLTLMREEVLRSMLKFYSHGSLRDEEYFSHRLNKIN